MGNKYLSCLENKYEKASSEVESCKHVSPELSLATHVELQCEPAGKRKNQRTSLSLACQCLSHKWMIPQEDRVQSYA